MIETWKGKLAYSLGLIILSAAITGSALISYNRKKANDALMRAEVLQHDRDAAVVEAKKAADKAAAFQAQADSQLMEANASAKKIADLKATVAKLKVQRPIGEPIPPIEGAQDDVIKAQDEEIGQLRGALDSSNFALAAKDEEIDHYKDALKADDDQVKLLKGAIKGLPKNCPWSAGLLYGKDDKNVPQVGAFVGRSFGLVRVEVVATQHVVMAGVGISF